MAPDDLTIRLTRKEAEGLSNGHTYDSARAKLRAALEQPETSPHGVTRDDQQISTPTYSYPEPSDERAEESEVPGGESGVPAAAKNPAEQPEPSLEEIRTQSAARYDAIRHGPSPCPTCGGSGILTDTDLGGEGTSSFCPTCSGGSE